MKLSDTDIETFAFLVNKLKDKLGSVQAADLWLITDHPQFDGNPLSEVYNGKVDDVLNWVIRDEILEDVNKKNSQKKG